MGGEALAVSEMNRVKNVAISGRFCREDSNLGPSKTSSHLTQGSMQAAQGPPTVPPTQAIVS